MQLMPGIRIVASGWLGYSRTADQDCTVYLLEDRGDAVLIDSGCGLATDAVLQHVAGAAVSRILLTHAHADHSAGASELATRLGARVLGSPECARIVAAGDELAAGLIAARTAGIYPPEVSLCPVAVEEINVRQSVGSLEVEALSTPGHAAGHHCYLVECDGAQVIFTGDLVFSRGRVAVLATSDTDLGALYDSLMTLMRRQPDVLLPGHGEVVLRDASRHLRLAIDAFEAGQLPPSLLA